MLNERSKQVRRDAYWLSKANGGYHYGGTFSTVEILINLFDHVMKPEDKFILSKGHGCWAYYTLLKEKGFNPQLEGHPKFDPNNGVFATTGSLGHGIPIGIGIALARKITGTLGRVWVLASDGEMAEGSTWESLLLASKFELDNITVIVDWNGIQGSGFTEDILDIDPELILRIADYNEWNLNLIDGHDNEAIKKALMCYTRRKLIIAKTIKGKGVSFMENSPKWHSNWPTPEFEKQLLEELA
jgi:transketolase